MTQDEMIDLAKQAGWQYAHGESGFEPLWDFAKLVAAKEREACALICDDQALGAYWEGADACADRIRARGEQA
jgi:hypothetical protein